MKQLLFLSVVIVFMLGLTTVSAQTYIKDKTNVEDAPAISALPSSLSMSQDNVSGRALTSGNAVFIEQLGDYNEAVINTRSQGSEIQLLQRGSDNGIFLNTVADQITQSVVQQGNNHRFVDFGNTSQIQSLEVIQSGNGQNLMLHGTNSISERMTISMQGENQSLELRNFN